MSIVRTAAIFIIAIALATVARANTAGTLYVTEDTILTADHNGNIVILADNVTLDCNGRTVTGPGDVGILVEFRTNVTVAHCRVTNFGFGISVADSISFSLIENVVAGSSAHGFEIERSFYGLLRGNVAQQNSGVGFLLENSSTSNSLVENRAAANSVGGFLIRFDSVGNVLEQNAAVTNGEGFVIESAYTQLLNNRAVENQNTGYWVRGAWTGTVLRGNLAQANFWGIVVHESDEVLVELNTLQGSIATGVSLYRANYCRLTSNTSNGNGNSGIELQEATGNNLHGNTANVNKGIGIALVAGASHNSVYYNTARQNGVLDALDDLSGVGNLIYANSFGTTEGF